MMKMHVWSRQAQKLRRQMMRVKSTLNTEEVNKFSSIGNDWWNSDSIKGAGPLHSMNPTRIDFIRRALTKSPSSNLSGLSICDVGCGGGLASEHLSRLGATVTGLDASAELIEVARKHGQRDPLTSNIEYIHGTIGSFSYILRFLMKAESISKERKFDAVVALEVIEHVADPSLFLHHCVASLKPSGSIILSTMNKTAKSFLGTIVLAEYVTGIVPRGTHDWQQYISPHDLTLMLERERCSVRRVQGMVPNIKRLLDATQPCWSLSDTDTDVNYILHAVVNS